MDQRLIHLNGTSSVGKSSVARAIQAASGVPWLTFSTDTLIDAMPSRWLADGDRSAEGLGRGTNGPVGERAVAAMYRGVAAVAHAGFDVIYEDVVLTPASWQASVEAWTDLAVTRVRLQCDRAVLAAREAARGDRTPGAAIALDDLIYPADGYDLELDTSAMPPAEVAGLILDAVGEW